jgi:hypothetical protein
MLTRRAFMVGASGASSAILSACATQATSDLGGSRIYCLPRARQRRRLCMLERIPSAAREEESKRFQPHDVLLTIYIVRWDEIDATRRICVVVDGGVNVATIPRSMARLRVPPGRHYFSFTWDGLTQVHALDGTRGSVMFLELAGTGKSLEQSYHWVSDDTVGTRARAQQSTLIADLKWSS